MENMDMTIRYEKAIGRIGHGMLLQLPDEIGHALKLTTDLTEKTKLLETIADVLEENGPKGLEEVAEFLREECGYNVTTNEG